jgi:hypothetical protein
MIQKQKSRKTTAPTTSSWRPMKGSDGISYLPTREADKHRSRILAGQLPKLLRRRGIVSSEVARQASIPPGRLDNLRKGCPLTKDQFARVADALKVPVDRILKKHGR